MDPLTALWLAAGVVVVLYMASARNPLRKCWRCGGSGKLRSWVLPWRYRPCSRCGRTGEVRGRLGRR